MDELDKLALAAAQETLLGDLADTRDEERRTNLEAAKQVLALFPGGAKGLLAKGRGSDWAASI
jgi:hypothetical protein